MSLKRSINFVLLSITSVLAIFSTVLLGLKCSGIVGGYSFIIFGVVAAVLHLILLSFFKWNRTKNSIFYSVSSGLVALAISNIWTYSVFFKNGNYINYGMLGTYKAIGILIVSNFVFFVATTLYNYFINCKNKE